ncbi:MAG: NAD(P)/FAD-dependent oxidoreductase [Bacteroidia bacterium]
MQEREYKVIIIGAGPAGLSASIHLSSFNIKHLIIEKSEFPRDKICGDAISGKVTSILKKLNPTYPKELAQLGEVYMPSWGVTFSAPNGTEVNIPFKEDTSSEAPGYIVKRMDFDNWLFQKINRDFADIKQNQKVSNIKKNEDLYEVHCGEEFYTAPIVLAGDGAHGIVAKNIFGYQLDRNHHCAGLRSYYSGVKNLSQEGFIELHFVKESLPGYFWIFPLPNGEANVGIGMLSKHVSKNKVDLKQLLQDVIQSKKFKDRFSEAQLVDKVQGWGLPLGSKKIELHKEGILLLGDAASLIDPFTGEGIGNAMISGRIAAECINEALSEKALNHEILATYTSKIYNKLWGELRLSRIMQKLIRYPRLFNMVLGKIERNEELKRTIMFMFENVDLRKQFAKPSFYFKILFK